MQLGIAATILFWWHVRPCRSCRIALTKYMDCETLFLPDSFEWLVLRSPLLRDASVDKLLEHPAEYIESSEFFSWETFFTRELVERTRDSYLEYRKSRLNPAYLQNRELGMISSELPNLGI